MSDVSQIFCYVPADVTQRQKVDLTIDLTFAPPPPTLRGDDENARRDVVVADGTHRCLVAAAGAGHNVAAVEEDTHSGQLPAQEADVAVAEELYLKLWHLEEKCGKGAAGTKGSSRGRRIESGTAGTRY